jgi:hypothetical protein
MTTSRPITKDAFPSPAYFADFAESYSAHIDELLQRLMEQTLDNEIHDFVYSFYTQLSNRPESGAILSRLGLEELDQLKSRQLQHLQSLFSRGTSPQVQYERALYVGWVHEMVGVSVPMLMEAYHLYHSKVEEILSAAVLSAQQRDELRAAIHQRLQLDIEGQTAIHTRFAVKIGSLQTALDDAIQKAGNLADLLRNSLQSLGNFDGISACLLSRPDAQGVMQIEAESGEEGSRYAESLRLKRVPLFETEAASIAGNGPSGRAWRSAQIQINDSFEVEATMHPWRAEAKMRGFRSSAAVPLLDESGQPFAILSLYSGWPGFFSAVTRVVMLRHIQQTMGHAILRLEQTAVIPSDLRNAFRQILEDGAVEMLYQPIIDLRSGKLDSLEALARLRDKGGQLIAPAAFLSAFGKAGLLRLFRLGLEQVCRDVRMWRDLNPSSSCSWHSIFRPTDSPRTPIATVFSRSCPAGTYLPLYWHWRYWRRKSHLISANGMLVLRSFKRRVSGLHKTTWAQDTARLCVWIAFQAIG